MGLTERKPRSTLKRWSSLLNKELRLSASPLTYFFVLFAATALVPGYPILVSALFVCLGAFYAFHSLKEKNDLLYSVLLPVPRTDVVQGKYVFACGVELAGFLIMAVLTVLRMTVLADNPMYVNNSMMPANPAFLAFVLLIFSAFNHFFLGGWFRAGLTAVGKPFLSFMAVAVVLVFVGEGLCHIPGFSLLRDRGGMGLLVQFLLLAASAAVCVLATVRACRQSEKLFERVEF